MKCNINTFIQHNITDTNYKNSLSCLGIEVTRRCNMNCAFCARGKAQNVDITKEIINKTLDEIQANDVYIHMLRFNGGEPTLNPEAIEYTIDEIIRRRLLVRYICIFTNGIEKSKKMRDALIRFVNYRHSIENEIALIAYKAAFYVRPIYRNTVMDGVAMIVSDYNHQTTEKNIREALEFYNYHDDYFSIVRQTTSFMREEIDSFIISGNMLNNYKQFLGNKVSLKQVRRINNEYNFAFKYKERGTPHYWVNKTISVSANGNVFVGCMTAYDIIDTKPIFNILDCNRNFINKIVKWCWEHPVNYNTKKFREQYEAIKWTEEKGIGVKEINKDSKQLAETLYKLTYAEEILAKDLHKLFPNLENGDLDALATAVFTMNMIENVAPKEWITTYLSMCSEYDNETIRELISDDNIALEWLQDFIVFLSKKDKKLGIERKKELAKTKNKYNK